MFAEATCNSWKRTIKIQMGNLAAQLVVLQRYQQPSNERVRIIRVFRRERLAEGL